MSTKTNKSNKTKVIVSYALFDNELNNGLGKKEIAKKYGLAENQVTKAFEQLGLSGRRPRRINFVIEPEPKHNPVELVIEEPVVKPPVKQEEPKKEVIEDSVHKELVAKMEAEAKELQEAKKIMWETINNLEKHMQDLLKYTRQKELA